MRAQFEKFPHLEMEFFDGVRISSRDQYPRGYDARARWRIYGNDLTLGEVGCYLSHQTLWKQCAESDDAAWLILEDDILLHDEFEDRVRLLMQDAGKWDVVRLMQLVKREGSWLHQALDGNHFLRAYDRQPCGTQGYLIKPAVAKKLAAYAERVIWPIDVCLDRDWEHGQRLFSIEPPAIAADETFDSEIGGHRKSVKRPLWQKLYRDLGNTSDSLRRRLNTLRLYGPALVRQRRASALGRGGAELPGKREVRSQRAQIAD